MTVGHRAYGSTVTARPEHMVSIFRIGAPSALPSKTSSLYALLKPFIDEHAHLVRSLTLTVGDGQVERSRGTNNAGDRGPRSPQDSGPLIGPKFSDSTGAQRMCAAIGGGRRRRGARGFNAPGIGVLPVAGGVRGGHFEANGSGWTHESLHRRQAGAVVHWAAKERAFTPRRSEVERRWCMARK